MSRGSGRCSPVQACNSTHTSSLLVSLRVYKQALDSKKQGNDHYTAKRFEEALACYEQAAQLDPTNMAFISNQAAVKMEQKDFAACEALCQKAVEVGRANRYAAACAYMVHASNVD